MDRALCRLIKNDFIVLLINQMIYNAPKSICVSFPSKTVNENVTKKKNLGYYKSIRITIAPGLI